MFDSCLNSLVFSVICFSVFEIKEDCEYKIDFFSGSNNLSLMVILCQKFPLEKPVLKIVPNVQHPWINENGEITSAPGLLNVSEVN